MKKKALVIADDQLLLYGLKKALNREALAVTTASSAWLAEETLRLCLFDLCLLDTHHPEQQGVTWLNFIKQRCPATKMILMTASALSEEGAHHEIIRATANGECHLLAKPFTLSEVKDLIRQLLPQTDGAGGGRCGDNHPKKNGRRFPRHPHSQELHIALSIFAEGEVQRWLIGARSVDISEGGIGLVTRYPLRVSQIISFAVDKVARTGIVVWSTMQKDGEFRARVRFT